MGSPASRRASVVVITIAAGAFAAAHPTAHQKEQIVRVPLEYHAPVTGQPKPNFSPKGMQVPLADVAAGTTLPAGAVRPAKTGKMQLGTDQSSWIPVLATASTDHPKDLCQLFIDRNRNGNFADDGPGLTAVPSQREKTLEWWSSVSNVELTVPYSTTRTTEKYFVNFWIVRPNEGPAPNILRFSTGSWRSGSTKINGIDAFVAAMDSDNNAVFDKEDMWSVLEASAPDAAKNVLSINEARETRRFMFVKGGPKDAVLEFRSFSPDGRSVEFAVVDKPMSKAEDRKPDDSLAPERARPRATTPFTWGKSLPAALSAAASSKKQVFIDFETDWCGPCHQMDQWIWTDAEVADALNGGFVGVKLDGDLEKALVAKYKVAGYPTMIVLDAAGNELWRVVGYQSSKEILEKLRAK